MIEIIKEETMEERRRREEGFSLPKNIRQIGEVEEGTKVYIEDYVMTYFKQLATYEAESEIVLILYGYRREINGTCYYFISGAIRVKEVNSCLYNTLFNQEDWKKINEEAAHFFHALSVLGWAFMKLEDEDAFRQQITGTHEEFFRAKQPIFVQYMIADKEEKVYLYQNGVMQEQKGHYVYYERNEMMQNYLVSLREEENKIEEEQVDHAAKQFRMVVQEKKEQRKRRKTNALLYATSLVLAFVIVLIGITMLGHYEKMQNMEKVLYQIANTTSTQERTINDDTNGQAIYDTEVEGEQAQPTISQPKSNIADETQDTQLSLSDRNDEKINQEKDWQNTNSDIDSPNGQTVSVNAVSDNAIETTADTNIIQADQMQSSLNGTNTTQEKDQKPENKTNEMQEDTTQTDEAQAQQTSAPVYQTYQIKRGDTLEEINQRFYGSVNRIDEICALNNIQNKDNICYGEKILLPQ